jgi:hypothetical protein
MQETERNNEIGRGNGHCILATGTLKVTKRIQEIPFELEKKKLNIDAAILYETNRKGIWWKYR